MAAEAAPAVEALLAARMAALAMDGEAYANYAACMLAERDTAAEEVRATLLEMLTLTVDDGRDLAADIGAMLDDARKLQDEVTAAAAAAAAAEEEAAAAALAALTLPRDGTGVAVSLLPSKDAGMTLDDTDLDADMRRALAARYGYIEESTDSETEAANAAAAAKAAAKAARRAKEPTVARSSKLDSALSNLTSMAAVGPDTRGMGRRAKRTVLAGAAAAEAAAAPTAAAATASPASPAEMIFATGPAASPSARAGVAAARDSDIGDIVGGASGGGGGGGGDDDSDEEGRRGRRGRCGGGGGRRRRSSSSSGGRGGGGGGGGMVEFDPLSIQLNNKAVAKEAERAKRDEARAKHEDEERALREAAEAARAARAKAMQSRLGGTGAGAGAGAGRGRGRPK